jgi:hypothetical protein
VKRALALMLVVCGCEKHEAPQASPTPPSVSVSAPAPASVPAPVASVPSAAPTGPTYLRLPVVSSNVREAFDGDPFTIASSKGPFDAKLAQKRKIKRVRVVGTDVKDLTVTFDGGAPLTSPSTEIDVDLDAQSVKVSVGSGTVAEVELYGELSLGIATAPEDLAERVKLLEGKPSAEAVLKTLGFAAIGRCAGSTPALSPCESIAPGVVESARSFRAQLDRDSEEEGIVQIATPGHTYVVFIDDEAHGRAVVGTRDLAYPRCDAGAPGAELKAQPVHAQGFSDVVITSKPCDGSEQAVVVVTLERGMAETLSSFRSKKELHFGSAFPKTIELLAGPKVEERHAFDPVAFRYR